MSGKPEQEPSIEEILASIRQIISDDDQPREAGVDLSQGPEEKFEMPVAQSAPMKEPPKSSFADVLDLTNEIKSEPKTIKYEEEKKYEIPVAVPEPKQEISRAPMDLDFTEHKDDDALFTSVAAAATSQAFSKLMGNIPVEREENKTIYADGRITLEDIVKDMLRPMLREWINDHMPPMVERLVEKELSKLTKQVRD